MIRICLRSYAEPATVQFLVYTLGGAALMADPAVQPDLSKGLAMLWNPSVIVFYQLLWWVLFLYHGRSKVTTSEISIQVEMDRT